jgi:tetratricopeptide (TPR) repeat protein
MIRRTHVALLALCVAARCFGAQPPAAATDQALREQASQLFTQGRRLEALPLLEQLVAAHPEDGQLLVALAACLVEHAATIADQGAAGKERLRARDLVHRAMSLGNTSVLAMNLSELLDALPASGALKFSDDPAVEQAMRAGEAAFSRREFVSAIGHYSRALELDPRNYTAALFIANTYDKEGELRRGAEWYERAIRLDPNTETAYRYYADMLARKGEMMKARSLLIGAAVAEPYNPIVWRELRAWATLNGTSVREVFVAIPVHQEAAPKTAGESPELTTIWEAYRRASASWRSGNEFKRRFPEETHYRHSLPEEAEALTAAAKALQGAARDPNLAQAVRDDPNTGLLLRLYDAGLIEPYILFSLGDRGIARDYASYRAKHRNRLEEYLNRFVLPPG